MAGDNLGVARGSIQINTSELKNADIALRSAGDSMINFGTQAVGAFAYVVGEAAKFEKEMDFVGAVTAASGEEMDKLKDKAIDLGKNSIFGPVVLAEAFVELAKAGASTKDIIDGVGEAAINLATAADVEIPFAGENLINTLNTFKLGADDAVRVSDLLAGSANASSVELVDLFTSLKYAGPVAQGLGIDIEDLNDAMSILGKVGIKGSTAGTSLRQIMLNLSPPTKKASDQMKALGIITEDGTNQFFDAEGKAKSLSDVFQILGESTKDLTNEQKTAALRDLFGVRAIPAALELMSQGEAGFKAINEEINRTTAADVAAERMDNLDGSIKRLKATLQAVFVEAGGPFQEMLKGWVDGLREAILFVDRLPGPLKTFLVGAVGVIGVLSLLSGVFLLTIGNIVRAVRVVGEIKNAFSLFSGAAKTAAGANKLLGASFLLNPMFLLVVAIVAIIAALVLLYFHFKPFREFVDKLWQDIQVIWDKILNFFKGLPAKFKEYLAKADQVWEDFKERVKEIVTNVYNSIKEQLGKAVDFVQSIPGKVGDALSEMGEAILKFGTEAWESFLTFMADLPRRIGYSIGFIIGRFLKFGMQLKTVITDAFNKALATMIEWGTKAVTWAYETAVKIVNAIINFLISLPGRIYAIFMGILTWLIAFVPMVIQTAWNIGFGIVTAIIDFLIALPGRVIGFFTEILNWLLGFVPQAFGVATDIGGSILNGIIDIVTGIPGRVGDIIGNVISAFTDMISTAFNAARDFAGGLWDGFKDGLGINSPSFIEEAMFAIDDQMKSSTANLAQQVKKVQRISAGIPTLNAGAVGLSSPAFAASMAGVGAGTQYNQNAPLIGQATIKDERDAYVLANELEKERLRRQRGFGGK